ncbi:glycosyltransferase [Gloeocapsa sp. PCC 73106]|uniref:glycosyltransferase n=1 Tax=Gloeocapsa sp. PCC 73106 TaxID=102232 RepID=UPI0002AC6240|nr:glycosyltransferase [Gloeocapsa sp. PCC 73106]ELR96303.1 glycosyltransferase [Gloeocapsa sp. PCC 73106]
MSQTSIKVLFFTTRLGGGGAEKLLLRIINNLDRQRFQLFLALCKGGGSYEADLAEDIEVYYLVSAKIPSISGSLLLSLLPLRQLIKRLKPDIVCGVMDNANLGAIAATLGLTHLPKTILSVHNPVSVKYNQLQGRWANKLVFKLIPALYPQANAIICVSQGVATDLEHLVPKTRDLLRVIYNPCVDAKITLDMEATVKESIQSGTKLIVACGRLNQQKGFSDLIKALVTVQKLIPTHLWIIGEGELRPVLQSQIESLGLSESVRLLGFQANPYQYMAKADVFVLSSIYEGFGNVIVEAMACGTPVVATDCPYGPREIINSGVNGLLVKPGDSEALAEGIIQVLQDPQLQVQFARQGKIRAQDFDSVKIAKMYGELFISCLSDIYADFGGNPIL